ncbi:MAG: PhzF family phenazine biosynthesis protein [Holosporales bacterium]|jgi:PhzF family phenazine biosynthesis protein|nr:PhzF family phenazine biosynthesis protein [Holosporales bacterium]
MYKFPLWLIDAFTDSPFKGNPAGVCLVDCFPDYSAMQKIAFEMHWSETAFLKKISENNYHIRWFSPEDEAPICGHATLASAHFLFEKKLVKNCVEFKSIAGNLTVKKDGNWLVMDFPACKVTKCEVHTEIDLLKKVLGNVNVEEVYRDTLIYVIILKSEQEVWNCVPDFDLLKILDCRAISITAISNDHVLEKENVSYDFVSRYFAPKVGIPEDPVCGSSHCRLTPLWSMILGKKSMIARQLSKRGGVLKVTYYKDSDRVSIAGQAITVLKGETIIP